MEHVDRMNRNTLPRERRLKILETLTLEDLLKNSYSSEEGKDKEEGDK